MHLVKEPDVEPIPGYRLIEPLGRGGFGEVWKCTAPGGLIKAVKFVSAESDRLDDGPGGAEQELRALQLIKTIRHPFLLSIDRIEVIAKELILVMELADRNLNDLFKEYQAAGLPGVPRAELLMYLREAAEVLDLMNLDHGLQHLDIKPANLFLVGRHIKVADFGLVNSLAELQGGAEQKVDLGAITPLYASPECFLGRISLYSDQYSLAMTYHELLTGTLPYAAKNFRQLAHDHLQVDPDLSRVSDNDRAALARALSREPRDRFPSSTALLDALDDRPPRPSTMIGVLPPISDQGKRATDADIRLTAMAAPTAVMPSEPLRQAAARTDTMRNVVSPNETTDAALPGVRFLECVARQPTGEIWRIMDTQGRPRLMRLIYGFEAREGPPNQTPFDRLKRLKHAMLVPQEIIAGDARLALVTETPEKSLFDELTACQQNNQKGIPRVDLLEDLLEIARTLDALHDEYNLHHLTLSPRNLVLLPGGRLLIADFGLTEVIWLPSGHQAGALNTRYAAPELFENQITRASDQYSLALIYAELLTGVHPFRNLNPRQMASSRQRGSPDVSALSSADRLIILRALNPDPEHRYPTCEAFIEALRAAAQPRSRSGLRAVTVTTKIEPTDAAEMRPTPPPILNRILRDLIRKAANGAQVCEFNSQRYLLYPGQRVEHHCFARLVSSTIKLKLDGFRQQWNAKVVQRDARSSIYQLPLPSTMMQRLLGRHPLLEVKVEMLPCENRGAKLTPLLLTLTPQSCDKPDEVLSQLTIPLLENLRNYLQAAPERRQQERWPTDYNATVHLAHGDRLPVAVRVRDISLTGVGLILPAQLPADEIYLVLDLPQTEVPQLIIPGQLLHGSTNEQGQIEAGVRFAHNGD